jgi:hypothetical protein
MKRFNQCLRKGSSLANKNLAAFHPASVTLSLACFWQTSPVDWTNIAKTDTVSVIAAPFHPAISAQNDKEGQ